MQGVLTYCWVQSCCGARCSPWQKPESSTDRGHSLRSLHLPPAALPSLPPLEYPHTLRGRVACLCGPFDLCRVSKNPQIVKTQVFDDLRASLYSGSLHNIETHNKHTKKLAMQGVLPDHMPSRLKLKFCRIRFFS